MRESRPVHESAQDGTFEWDTLGVILEGSSALELPAMAVESRAQARDFLKQYGLDLDNARDLDEMRKIHLEAVAFIRKYFLSTTRLAIPNELVEPEDLSDILVTASLPGRPLLARWACAMLRVMHTIHHANRAFRKDSMDDIRKHIFEPYRECLQVDELGCPVLARGTHRVQLEGVFFKEDKSRDSIILKLLHKPSNVAQEIYDWIGIQFVTRTRVEALLVVRFLRIHNLVIFANIVPGRSVNNLIDLKGFRGTFEELRDQARAQDDTHELWLLEHLTHESRDFQKLAATVQNPFSGPEYRSIQFTMRQLVRIPNPARRPIERIQAYLSEHSDDPRVKELGASLAHLPLEKELSFFFPYEIQILDYENYLKTRMGQSSHAAYKKRQILAARRRVLQGII